MYIIFEYKHSIIHFAIYHTLIINSKRENLSKSYEILHFLCPKTCIYSKKVVILQRFWNKTKK